MQEIIVENQAVDDLLNQLNQYIHGEIKQQWGETLLTFDNDMGTGTIRSIVFDWGISLIDYDIHFLKPIKIVFRLKEVAPVEFIFVSEGSLKYRHNGHKDILPFERYQNIIISPLKNSKKTFFFPENVRVRANFIQIIKEKYSKKRHNNIKYLNEVLLSVFEEKAASLPFEHLGNFNLKIADQVKEIQGNKDEGMVRTLNLEGRLNIILAMQLLEHHKFENEEILPESLSRSDIKKIHQLSEYIVDNISEPLTIRILSHKSSLSPKKLQLGFRMLYSNSVNEYIKRMKLEISRDYLEKTDLSISEIVYKVGIKSRSYFSKIFSDHYGILPTEYRAKLKKKV
ncbi:MAG: AraC family transcriptional regulator [Muricauda sp.]|nr:AraC family transcriptional regulator [Allomuricauda sp.]MBC31791.1 AraC family transcriptional regulator [Allomuricauda sp.]|tara:strand:+ start:2512 stop:3534 length:1023 start_codon:yes stop_codon:yes gene_type:complete